jgi:hypothetical protein
MKNIMFCFAVLCAALHGHSQSWTNHYNGIPNGDDYFTSMAMDSLGNVFVAGISDGPNTFSPDSVLIKYSNSGAALWVKRYTIYNHEITNPGRISVDDLGNVLVVGSVGPSQHDQGLWMMKVSSSGQKLWTNQLPATEILATAIGRNGEVAVIIQNTNLIKYSDTGLPLWTNVHDLGDYYNDQEPFKRITLDDNGHVLVTTQDKGGYAIVKYSNSGERLWTGRYKSQPGAYLDFPGPVAVDRNGNVIVTGSVGMHSWLTNGDLGTVKFSSAGVPLWTNRYSGLPNQNLNMGGALGVHSDGSVAVTGRSGGISTDVDWVTIKYSSSGVPLWTNIYGGGDPDINNYHGLNAMDAYGNVIVTGVSVSTNGSSEYVTIKYSSSGVPLWTNRMESPTNSYFHASTARMEVDLHDNIILAGTTQIGADGHDLFTLKYAAPPALKIQSVTGGVVLSWGYPALRLQSAPGLEVTFTNVPGATSPHTTSVSGPQHFFRLAE